MKMSILRTIVLQFSNYKNKKEKSNTLSFGFPGSFDDGFLDVWDLEKSFTDENEELPMGLGNLLKGPLLGNSNGGKTEEEKGNCSRPPLRRFNSLAENYTSSPASSRARVGLFRDETVSKQSPGEKLPFKRPREIDSNSCKRRKSNSLHTIPDKVLKDAYKSRYKLQRSISETAASSLALTLHKSDLIADFSRPYALPFVSGRHEDLKSITSETLASLINGEFNAKVNSFKIIDCRYPYEYDGGHIIGSINLYTKEQVEEEFFDNKGPLDAADPSSSSSSDENDGLNEKRNILIFHCEFSLERGPALYRFLRRCDRNLSNYPSLHYPEVYLLHGGYKSFFSTHKSLCEPCFYQPMVDPKHENDLKKFRVKSNSWSGDNKKQTFRSGLKRLGLF
ncbi:M-phase inducer phosphatase, putative [Pediculus humanus corporis]|uniref:protein-tyrosine-phosphatase n=1 Tax=Pediculus humanus subsp. corporis TaxID=121224 RepID=E0VSL0_PEDHC|nr:M-phase inducer phosphatase, putative [Pediculus humanus corporis]EEB16366.1 M-phase inducer phosphatase, putative [Pediculus humanus corporis]